MDMHVEVDADVDSCFNIKCQSYFKLPGGSTVQNILSAGPDGMLFLTFTYEWKFPGIRSGTSEARTAEYEHGRIARSSVQGTIRALRTMVGKGML